MIYKRYYIDVLTLVLQVMDALNNFEIHYMPESLCVILFKYKMPGKISPTPKKKKKKKKYSLVNRYSNFKGHILKTDYCSAFF